MKNHEDLFRLFIDELEDTFSSEHQIIESLPKFIRLASSPDLKEALAKHLHETENQAKRIEQIFSILEINGEEKNCEGMQGILRETEELTENRIRSPILDAAIISAAQKIEHYEIASYGTLKSFAKFLDLDSEIVDLLQDTLDEEAAADKKLTKIAEGSLFTTGINKEAVKSRR